MSLRLIAEDADDLSVVSAAMQDAIVGVGTMAFDSSQHCFVVQASRYRHETGQRERIFCGLRIDNVLAARVRGIDRSKRDAFAVLLDMAFQPGEAPGGELLLRFAGGGEIRLTVEALDLILADVGRAHAVASSPSHA